LSARATVLLALLLAASPASAAPRSLRPPEPNEPKRWALDATLSPALFNGASVAAGVRARVRDDPFQFELSWDRDLTTLDQPDFRWLLLGGGGLARDLSPRWTFFGSFLIGAYGVAVRELGGDGWLSRYGPAVGARLGISRRLPLRFLGVEPTVGFSTTVLIAAIRHDPFRGVTFGGPVALFGISLGFESLRPGDAADRGAP
jgi:hypothetical protein